MAPSNAQDRLIELAELMKRYCLTQVEVAGFKLSMDPRGFAVQPVHATVVPPAAASPEVDELFRPMTDEELLMLSAAPLAGEVEP